MLCSYLDLFASKKCRKNGESSNVASSDEKSIVQPKGLLKNGAFVVAPVSSVVTFSIL